MLPLGQRVLVAGADGARCPATVVGGAVGPGRVRVVFERSRVSLRSAAASLHDVQAAAQLLAASEHARTCFPTQVAALRAEVATRAEVQSRRLRAKVHAGRPGRGARGQQLPAGPTLPADVPLSQIMPVASYAPAPAFVQGQLVSAGARA
jgi:hypothetical protein